MEPFKNLYSEDTSKTIATALKGVWPDFNRRRFLNNIGNALQPLELKARMQLLADRIETELPPDPEITFPLLIQALAKDETSSEGLSGFSVWPLTEIIARRGLNHFNLSMFALSEMTSRFTAEFAIRPFLREFPNRTLAQLEEWTQHPNEHIRRLVSEGSRPLLPWGERLTAIRDNPKLTQPLLEKLKDDPSEYVRRSIANHLNDHSKGHPEYVLDIIRKWLREVNGNESSLTAQNRLRLARHATRTLLKSGHARALKIHGYAPPTAVELIDWCIHPKAIQIGTALHYRLNIRNRSDTPAKILFDYAIHHQKANGTHSPKVFRGRERKLQPGEVWSIEGKHPIRPVTTRKYYPGIQHFEPRINGKAFPRQAFTLLIGTSS